MATFNTGNILRDAWARYRAWDRTESKAFRWALRAAWRSARDHAAMEELIAADPAFTAQAAAVRGELHSIDLSGKPVDRERHRALTVELFRLSAPGEAPAKHA